ncbi:DUF3833 domain-containing protein [Gilvimarinus polysaccharolyticus]|uniref:DUF3833 domain-containing protein n=1 Tax=Gilvimarinus polysaccharolyticus TaxID=863921 RepID=UPI0006733F57|nr:DUF3833 domain-containing protein [Gilvimarinus polysaccharolyticus]
MRARPWFSPVLITFLIALTGCAGPNIEQYQTNRPNFAPEQFFQGPLTAHGVLKNRSGQVTRYFNATIDASWSNGIGTLAERFVFDDGEIQHRTWTLTPTSNTTFNATAGDVIGTGTGATSGNALNLNYVLEVDYKNRKLNLAVDDWMWRVDEHTVINQSTLSKWGFTVGTIQLVISRPQQ